ncbi:unnamed protein product [Musa acuminata var. zebrina]
MSGQRVAHQLSNGMVVSGLPTSPKERSPSFGSRAVPYTGGDVRKSGELGRMFDIPVGETATASTASPRPRSGPHSGPLPRSSPSSRRTSAPPSPIPATGLITSGPARYSSRQQTPATSPAPARRRKEYGAAVTVVDGEGFVFGVSRAWRWVLVAMFVVGVATGAFVWAAVGRPEILVGVAAAAALVVALAVWSCVMGRMEVERFLRCHPNYSIDPRNLPIGKLVKITGHVTCGSIPLEASYQKISRCIYISTDIYEYRGWSGLPAKPNLMHFSWGLRNSERHIADFYISDSATGMRFLVRAGNGAKVTTFVKPTTILDMNKEKKQLSPDFLSWLMEHNLSSDDRIMRLKEGYIKEGHTASVMGILKKHENLIMIDPPADMVSTGCRWTRCFLPLFVEGLILIGDERPDEVVYQV